MRLYGIMIAFGLVAWGCGDDSGSSNHDSDSAPSSLADGGADSQVPWHLLDGAPVPGARDGSVIVVTSDGSVVVIQPDGAVVPSHDAAVEAGADSGHDMPTGPLSAAFTLASPSGTAPLFEQALSAATGTVETTYDWGEGAGFEASATHRYRAAGSFTVTQKVRDVSGLTMTASKTVVVNAFTPVRFSTTDRTNVDQVSYHDAVYVSPDGFEVAQVGIGTSGVRSDSSIASGAGIFYFEEHRIADHYYRGAIGIATAAASLTFNFDPSAQNSESAVTMLGDGSLRSAGGACTGQGKLDTAQSDLGFIVDYRGTSPVLHFLQGAGTPSVVATCTLPVSAPVFVYYSGERTIVGNELRINTGADTVNLPFHYDAAAVRAALTAVGDAAGAAALVMGFGKTNAGRLDSPPNLTIPGDMTVPFGQSVMLTGSADDAEDGSLAAQINWVDTSLAWDKWTPIVGPSFAFSANTLGLHPVVVTVQDLDGVVTKKTVTVTVTGALPLFNPVQMLSTPESVNAGIHVSPDGLSAEFLTDTKSGVRANQGILGDYWYFEVHRNTPTRNMGMGLVIEDGRLLPYEFDQVPWSTSINVLADGSCYVNLILKPGAGGWQVSGVDDADYGFAVDYRGMHPLVHVIIGNRVQTTLSLSDTWVPIYPMLYGNAPDWLYDSSLPKPPPDTYDYTINFGASGFAQDPRAALGMAGIDATGFKLGWGVNAR